MACLCDLGLPDIDGEELIGKIRAVSDVPVIVLSARGREQDRIKALDLGADDFVAKPFPAGDCSPGSALRFGAAPQPAMRPARRSASWRLAWSAAGWSYAARRSGCRRESTRC
jgi:two-component system KDP operon response regulator KdpE